MAIRWNVSLRCQLESANIMPGGFQANIQKSDGSLHYEVVSEIESVVGAADAEVEAVG